MQSKTDCSAQYPESKYTLIGAGIISYIAAYYLWKQSEQAGTSIRITLHEKNHALAQTTASNISPSLTMNEIMSVVPPAPELLDKLKRLFNEPGGIRVDGLGVNGSKVYTEFLSAVENCGKNPTEHTKRMNALYGLGVLSMNAWQQMYDSADEQLKAILLTSNFQPCREPPNSGAPELHDGYRIDLIYDVAPEGQTNCALKKAQDMSAEFKALGYEYSQVLSPEEVMRRDPYLREFCMEHADLDSTGTRVWKSTASAVWRPGGCIDTCVFLPLFHEYLTQKMGTYTNAQGKVKNNFRVHYDRKVEGLSLVQDHAREQRITGVRFFGQDQVKKNKHDFKQSQYLFCPGENVGTLKKLGLPEPEYTRFAGPSLRLMIDLSPEQIKALKDEQLVQEVLQCGDPKRSGLI
jgi:hypothetical protein